MKLKYKKYEVRHSGILYTILEPMFAFEELYICEVDKNSFVIFGNKSDLVKLGSYMKVLCSFKNIILHIPAQKSATEYLKERWNVIQPYDLVIVSHSAQLNFKVWKNIRHNNKKYEVLTIEERTYPTSEDEFRVFSYKTNKDVLKVKSRYDTLFLTGSEFVFKHVIEDCVRIGNEGEQLFHRFKGYHDHAHLEYYLSSIEKYNRSVSITLDYYDEKLWNEL